MGVTNKLIASTKLGNVRDIISVQNVRPNVNCVYQDRASGTVGVAALTL